MSVPIRRTSAGRCGLRPHQIHRRAFLRQSGTQGPGRAGQGRRMPGRLPLLPMARACQLAGRVFHRQDPGEGHQRSVPGRGTRASDAEKDRFIREVKRLRPHHRVLLHCNRSLLAEPRHDLVRGRRALDRRLGDGGAAEDRGVLAHPPVRRPAARQERGRLPLSPGDGHLDGSLRAFVNTGTIAIGQWSALCQPLVQCSQGSPAVGLRGSPSWSPSPQSAVDRRSAAVTTRGASESVEADAAYQDELPVRRRQPGRWSSHG